MKIFTSNFAKSGRDPKAVSIARLSPTWFSGRRYSALAPSWDIIKGKLTAVEFERLYYQKILLMLQPQEVVLQLGEGAILLCWEKAEDFCHRQIVAKWLRENGAEVEELQSAGQTEKKESAAAQLSIF
jgi:uncharacterized protein (DUF488 family)